MPVKNINVEKDVMLCPACGETSSFAEAAAKCRFEESGGARLGAPPPKHLSVKSEIDPSDASETVSLVYRKFDKNAIFLVPFTLVWAGGSMGMIYGSQIVNRTFSWPISLFGLPFLLGSIFLVSQCLFALFGKRVLTLKRGNGLYFSGVGCFGKRIRFVYNRNTTMAPGYVRAMANNGDLNECLELRNEGDNKTYRICAGMDDDALEYVAASLSREMRRI